jgi:hypothetical protein
MIKGALRGATAVVKRLPELGRTSAERRRLEEFAKARDQGI